MSNQRRVILQFFYAVCGVKSNQLEWSEVGTVLPQTVRILAVLVLGLSGFLAAQSTPPLAIVDDNLPAFNAGVEIHVPLHATGGVPPYHWSAPASDLPEGMILTSEGLLTGRPAKPGASALSITVEDSGHPAHSVNKAFRALVTAALLLEWLRPPVNRGNRVDGTVQVSNDSKNDFDLTVIIVAVNAAGRATALGYQHVRPQSRRHQSSDSLRRNTSSGNLCRPCRCRRGSSREELHPAPAPADTRTSVRHSGTVSRSRQMN